MMYNQESHLNPSFFSDQNNAHMYAFAYAFGRGVT